MRVRIVLSCFLLLVPCDIGAIQVRPSERRIVLEPEINEKVLAFKPEQVPILTERASADEVEAQCVLVVAYERGSSVPRDDARATKWLTKVAVRGAGWAQNPLGIVYQRGGDVPTDYSEVFKWFHSATEQRYPAVANNLGYMFLNGRRVRKDYVQAAYWFPIGDAEAYPPAQNNQQVSVASQTALSSLTEPVSTMPAAKPTPKVAASAFTVMVFNFRQVSTEILSNAEKEADRIFAHSGVKIVWQECPTGNEPCRKGPSPVFFLAIKAGPVQNKFLDVVSGQAIVANHIAVVYYDSLPRVARGQTTPREASTLLACVIAHELGHLLLGAHGHSIHGIMKERWDIEQTRLALMSELDFLPEEGKLMRSALLDGTQPGDAAQPALVSSH